MSNKELIINTNPSETRLALLENDIVAELYIERQKERGMVGNIYKGTITRVLPGMQSAFVDIGSERSAFLHGDDVYDPDNIETKDNDKDDEDIISQLKQDRRPIEQILQTGQKVTVQVAKDPLGSKGARVSMFISLPGRYVVLMPNFNHVGISRRIESEAERKRLRDIVRQIKPEGVGVIIRTAAQNSDSEQITKDLKYLIKIWQAVDAKRKRSHSPALLYQEPDIIIKITRDLYSEDVSRILIDDKESFERLRLFLTSSIPGARKKLELYEKSNPIFDECGIEMDIARALSSKVWLPSGGYLIIDQTEALTSFDVNTGKFVGHFTVQDTILKTNVEAVKEIVAQLRIRNIGGIIVLDFIDIERSDDRDAVFNLLQEELKKDKARTNVLKISELGLAQMTRKRTSESLEQQLTEHCPYCNGRGRIQSVTTEVYNLLRDIERAHLRTGQKNIRVRVREDIKRWLLEEEKDILQAIIKRCNISVDFLPGTLTTDALHEASYEVLAEHK